MRTLFSRHANPATAIALVALVFAMSGGAYALGGSGDSGGSGGVNARVAKAKSKAKKSARGPAGPRGPEGKQGAEGKAGPEGKEGKAGASGKDGAGATTETFAGKEHGCEEGGVTIKSASGEAVVCNGKAGANGQSGFTETLPAEKTETGTWAFGRIVGIESAKVIPSEQVPISFAIPLPVKPGKASLTHHEVHFVLPNGNEVIKEQEEPEVGCPGSVEAPKAEPGNLCIYVEDLNGVDTVETEISDPHGPLQGAGATGAVIEFFGLKEGALGFGTWAVTAP